MSDFSIAKAICNQLQLSTATEAVRLECADAFASEYADGMMPERQRRVVEIALAMLVEVAAQEVRAAIARNVENCPFLPRDLARALANDVVVSICGWPQLARIFWRSDDVVGCGHMSGLFVRT